MPLNNPPVLSWRVGPGGRAGSPPLAVGSLRVRGRLPLDGGVDGDGRRQEVEVVVIFLGDGLQLRLYSLQSSYIALWVSYPVLPDGKI